MPRDRTKRLPPREANPDGLPLVQGKLSPTSPDPSASQATKAAERTLDALCRTPEGDSHFPVRLTLAKTPDNLVLVRLRQLATTSFSLHATCWVVDHYTQVLHPPLETAPG